MTLAVEQAAARLDSITVNVIIALVALTGFMIGTDLSLVSVALPTIGQTLPIAPSLLPWVVTVTSLGLGGFLIVGGRASDAYGQRPVFLSGVALFGVASLLAAAAASFAVLVMARGVEGIGAALMAPSSFSMINTLLPQGALRRRALGAYGIMQGVALVIGPFLGGALTSAVGWRGVFLVMPPVAAISFLLGWRYIPAPARRQEIGSDLIGIALVIVTPALVMLSLSFLEHDGGASHRVLATMAAGVVAAILFLLIETRVKTPLMPPAIFRYQNMKGASVATLSSIAMGSAFFMTSNMYLQKGLHFSPYATGLGLLPFGCATIIGGQLCPFGLKRWSSRTVVLCALGLVMTGLVLLIRVPDQASYLRNFLPGTEITQIGPVISMVALMAMATASVPAAEQGAAAAIIMTAQQVGLPIGIAIVMTIMTSIGGMMGFRSAYLACMVLAAITAAIVLLFTTAKSAAPGRATGI